MSDFVGGFWGVYITLATLISVAACGVFLWMQGRAKHSAGSTMGHVWDEDLEEFNNPMPNWWRWMFYITIFFSLGYLVTYPGLGTYKGQSSWSSTGQYDKEMADGEATYGKIFSAYMKQDLKAVAGDDKARQMGERLFLTYCAQCHGANAKGSPGYPSLADEDWKWGGEPELIKTTIMEGRTGVMPPFAALGGEVIKDLANYVRSLSGLAADPVRVARGKETFTSAGCVACHGAEGKGNIAMGAPNLTDKIWLYGSKEETIVETISKGRTGVMPAQKDFLGEAKVHLLAAYVWSLTNKPGAAAAPAVK